MSGSKESSKKFANGRASAGACAALALVIAAALVLSAGSAAASSPTAPPAKRVKDCKVGSGPTYAGYDPVTHEMYVPNYDSGTITVLKGTCTLVGTITSLPSGACPVQAAFDPMNNLMFVTDDCLNQVYEISGTAVVTTLTSSSFDGPYGIIYNPGTDSMIVADSGGNSVSLIVGTTTVYAPEAVGVSPMFLCYDPDNNHILVSDYGGSNVTVLDAVYLTEDGSLAVGSEPSEMAYDPADYSVYVANAGSDNVSVYNDFDLVATISGFSGPFGVAWSQATLHVYVTNVGTGEVSIISGFAVIKQVATHELEELGATYDDFNDKVYVTDWGSGTGTQVFILA